MKFALFLSLLFVSKSLIIDFKCQCYCSNLVGVCDVANNICYNNQQTGEIYNQSYYENFCRLQCSGRCGSCIRHSTGNCQLKYSIDHNCTYRDPSCHGICNYGSVTTDTCTCPEVNVCTGQVDCVDYGETTGKLFTGCVGLIQGKCDKCIAICPEGYEQYSLDYACSKKNNKKCSNITLSACSPKQTSHKKLKSKKT